MYCTCKNVLNILDYILGGVVPWQNVKSAVKVQFSASRSVTLTEEVTEPGNPISERLELS